MANGEMLKELRSLADAEKIATSSALRLILSAVADMYEKVKCIQENQEKEGEVIDDLRDEYDQHVKLTGGETVKTAEEMLRRIEAISVELSQKIESQTQQLRNEIQPMKAEIEKVSKNPLVQIGRFIVDHPKWATGLFVGVVILSNVWFISGFRRAVLLLLHVPIEIINILAP